MSGHLHLGAVRGDESEHFGFPVTAVTAEGSLGRPEFPGAVPAPQRARGDAVELAHLARGEQAILVAVLW